MRVTIVGAGAIGGVTGAFLARAGADVTLVDTVEEHVRAIRRDGLRLDGLEEFTVRVPAIAPAELRGPLELVVIAVKTQHTGDALDEVAPHLGPDSVVMPLQNGLSALWIAERVGGERTVPTSITTQQYYIGPGHVRHLARGVVHVGEHVGRVSPRVEEIVRLLSQAYETHATDNVWGWIWAKMIASSIFFTTALVDAPIGPILTASDRHRRMFVRIAGETTALARAHGARAEPSPDLNADLMLPRTDAEWGTALAELDRMAERFRDVYTGIWRDIAVRKRRTEADSSIGPLIEEGEKAGLAMPLNRAMKRLLNEIEDGRRTQSWENLEELIQVAEREEPLPTRAHEG